MPPPMALLVRWPWRGASPRIIHRPESAIEWFTSHGWKVVAKDSDVIPAFNQPRIADEEK